MNIVVQPAAGSSFSYRTDLSMAAAAAAYDQHTNGGLSRPPPPPLPTSTPPPPSGAGAAGHHGPMSISPSSSASPPTSSATKEAFACSVCSKNFEKRTSRDRHTRRCRKKRPEDVIPRKKSCNHCANSKARCDQRRPQCTRCRSKNLSGCEYVYQQSSQEPQQHQHQHQQHAPLQHSQPDSSHHIDLGFTDPMLLGDVDMHTCMNGDLFWGDACPTQPHTQQLIRRQSSANDYNASPTLSLQINTPAMTMGHSSSSASPDSSCDFGLVGLSHSSQASDQNSLIARQPVLPPNAYPQVELVARLLASFPGLLKKSTIAHPFIHRQRLLPGKRAEPLANATAIVHMIAVKSADNKTFVSNMMTNEWSRLANSILNHVGEEGWMLLESFQALVIIGLLRLFDNDFDMKDVHGLEACAERIGFDGFFVPETGPLPDQSSNWDTWLFTESKRRTFMTAFLLDRLFHYRNGLPPLQCNSLGTVQLPASRKVWEANTAEEWEAELENVRNFPGWEGRSSSDWVTLSDMWEGSPRMGVWYVGMDVLSSAVMADAIVATGEQFQTRACQKQSGR